MADDITKSTEQLKQQIENAKLLKEAMEDLGVTGSSAFTELSKKMEDGSIQSGLIKQSYDEIVKSIQDVLGGQFKYATELEKTLLLNQEIAKAESLRLQKAIEIEKVQKSINENTAKREELEAALAEKRKEEGQFNKKNKKQQAGKYRQVLKEREALEAKLNLLGEQDKALEGQKTELNKIIGLTDDELDTINDTVMALRKANEERKKAEEADAKNLKIQEIAEGVAQNRLEATLGIKDTTADFADLLIDASGDAEALEATAQGIKKAFTKAFSPKVLMKTVKNLGKDLFKKAADFSKKSLVGVDSLQQKYEDLDQRIVQVTGASQKFGLAAQELSVTMRKQGFAMNEVENAMGGLYMSSAAFTRLSEKEQKSMGEMSLQLSRLGVSTDTFSASMDKMLKVLKIGPAETRELTEDLTKFGRALGMGPNKMLQQFNAQMPLLARYGKEKGIEMFKQLATTAHLAGVEMSDLINVAKKFDTFEGAAEAAAKLNFVLGGPLINSMEMLNATEEERIQKLREAMIASGKSFQQMNRWEKDLVAQQLNTTVDIAQAIFTDDSMDTIAEATAKIQEETKGIKALKVESKDATTEIQNRTAAAENAIVADGLLADALEWVNKKVTNLTGLLSGFAPIMLFVTMGFQVLQGALMLAGGLGGAGFLTKMLTPLMNAFKGASGGAGGLIKTLAGKLGLAGAFVAVGYAAFETGKWLKGAIDSMEGSDTKKNVTKGFFAGATGLAVGLGASLLSFVAAPVAIGLGLAAAGGMAAGLFEDGTDSLPRYANGIDSIGSKAALTKWGQAIITGDSSDGKAKPELTVAPPASSVINNKNLETMGSVIANITNPPPTQTMAPAVDMTREQTINLVLKLDEDVLARHSAKTAKKVIDQTFEFTVG